MTYDEAIKNIGTLVVGNKLATKYRYTTEGTIWLLEGVISNHEIKVGFKNQEERMKWKNEIAEKLGRYPREDEFEVDIQCFDLLRQNYYNTSKYGNNYKRKVAT